MIALLSLFALAKARTARSRNGGDVPPFPAAYRYQYRGRRAAFQIFRDFNLDAMRVDADGGRTVDGFGDQLKGTPAAGISRHRPTVETKIQEFLYTGRIQDGDHRIHECVFGLMLSSMIYRYGRHRRGAGRRCGRPEQVAVAKDIARAVDASPFAYHIEKTPSQFAPTDMSIGVPRTAVAARSSLRPVETDADGVREMFCLPELLVDQTQRRSSVTCDKAAVFKPAASSRRRCIMDGQRLRPCQKTRPDPMRIYRRA